MDSFYQLEQIGRKTLVFLIFMGPVILLAVSLWVIGKPPMPANGGQGKAGRRIISSVIRSFQWLVPSGKGKAWAFLPAITVRLSVALVGLTIVTGLGAMLTLMVFPDPLLGLVRDVDMDVMRWVHGNAQRCWRQVMAYITLLGGPRVVPAILALSSGLFLWRARYAQFLGVMASTVGAGILAATLKYIVGRGRPSAFTAYSAQHLRLAWPSAHTILAVCLYGYLAVVILVPIKDWRLRLPIVTGVTAIVGLVGLSRVVLELHWLSDVVSGILLGTLWLWLVVGLLNSEQS